MGKYKVWEDGNKDESIEINAVDMMTALDLSAQTFGFADYCEMSKAKQYGYGDGLNIVEIN